MTYPSKIMERLASLNCTGKNLSGIASGIAANFACGCTLRFGVEVDAGERRLSEIRVASNGCGYMVTAADVIADAIKGRSLSELHQIDTKWLREIVEREIDEIPPGRLDCIEVCGTSLRAAFADLRQRTIEEFRGEKALVCTCFAVTEDEIADAITSKNLMTVDDVTGATGAGGGCGSCLMLIDEMVSVK